jgi:hypothetical protein
MYRLELITALEETGKDSDFSAPIDGIKPRTIETGRYLLQAGARARHPDARVVLVHDDSAANSCKR